MLTDKGSPKTPTAKPQGRRSGRENKLPQTTTPYRLRKRNEEGNDISVLGKSKNMP